MEPSQQLWTLAVVATGAAFAPTDGAAAVALAGLAMPIPIVLTQAAMRIWVRRSAAMALLGCVLSALSSIALPCILASIVDEPQRAVLEAYCPVFAVATPALVVHAVLGDCVATRRRRTSLAVVTAASNVGLYYYLYTTSGARASAWPIVITTYADALGLGVLAWSTPRFQSRPTDDEGAKKRPTQALAAIVPWLLAVVLVTMPAPAIATSFLAYVGLGLEFGAGVARNDGYHRFGITVVCSGLVALTVVYGIPWAITINSTSVDKVVVMAFALSSFATVVGPPASPASTVGGAVVFIAGAIVLALLAPGSAIALWVLQALVQGAKCALICLSRQAPTHTRQETVHLLSGRPATDHGATTARTTGDASEKGAAPTRATSDTYETGRRTVWARWFPCCYPRRPQSYRQHVVLSTDVDGLEMYERHRVSPTLHGTQERARVVLSARAFQSARLLGAGNEAQPGTAPTAVDNIDQDCPSASCPTYHVSWHATSPISDSVQDRSLSEVSLGASHPQGYKASEESYQLDAEALTTTGQQSSPTGQATLATSSDQTQIATPPALHRQGDNAACTTTQDLLGTKTLVHGDDRSATVPTDAEADELHRFPTSRRLDQDAPSSHRRLVGSSDHKRVGDSASGRAAVAGGALHVVTAERETDNGCWGLARCMPMCSRRRASVVESGRGAKATMTMRASTDDATEPLLGSSHHLEPRAGVSGWLCCLAASDPHAIDKVPRHKVAACALCCCTGSSDTSRPTRLARHDDVVAAYGTCINDAENAMALFGSVTQGASLSGDGAPNLRGSTALRTADDTAAPSMMMAAGRQLAQGGTDFDGAQSTGTDACRHADGSLLLRQETLRVAVDKTRDTMGAGIDDHEQLAMGAIELRRRDPSARQLAQPAANGQATNPTMGSEMTDGEHSTDGRLVGATTGGTRCCFEATPCSLWCCAAETPTTSRTTTDDAAATTTGRSVRSWHAVVDSHSIESGTMTSAATTSSGAQGDVFAGSAINPDSDRARAVHEQLQGQAAWINSVTNKSSALYGSDTSGGWLLGCCVASCCHDAQGASAASSRRMVDTATSKRYGCPVAVAVAADAASVFTPAPTSSAELADVVSNHDDSHGLVTDASQRGLSTGVHGALAAAAFPTDQARYDGAAGLGSSRSDDVGETIAPIDAGHHLRHDKVVTSTEIPSTTMSAHPSKRTPVDAVPSFQQRQLLTIGASSSAAAFAPSTTCRTVPVPETSASCSLCCGDLTSLCGGRQRPRPNDTLYRPVSGRVATEGTTNNGADNGSLLQTAPTKALEHSASRAHGSARNIGFDGVSRLSVMDEAGTKPVAVVKAPTFEEGHDNHQVLKADVGERLQLETSARHCGLPVCLPCCGAGSVTPRLRRATTPHDGSDDNNASSSRPLLARNQARATDRTSRSRRNDDRQMADARWSTSWLCCGASSESSEMRRTTDSASEMVSHSVSQSLSCNDDALTERASIQTTATVASSIVETPALLRPVVARQPFMYGDEADCSTAPDNMPSRQRFREPSRRMAIPPPTNDATSHGWCCCGGASDDVVARRQEEYFNQERRRLGPSNAQLCPSDPDAERSSKADDRRRDKVLSATVDVRDVGHDFDDRRRSFRGRSLEQNADTSSATSSWCCGGTDTGVIEVSRQSRRFSATESSIAIANVPSSGSGAAKTVPRSDGRDPREFSCVDRTEPLATMSSTTDGAVSASGMNDRLVHDVRATSRYKTLDLDADSAPTCCLDAFCGLCVNTSQATSLHSSQRSQRVPSDVGRLHQRRGQSRHNVGSLSDNASNAFDTEPSSTPDKPTATMTAGVGNDGSGGRATEERRRSSVVGKTGISGSSRRYAIVDDGTHATSCVSRWLCCGLCSASAPTVRAPLQRPMPTMPTPPSPRVARTPPMAISRAPSQASFDDGSAPTSRRGSFIRMASKRIQSLQHSRRQSLVDDDPSFMRSRRQSVARSVGATSPRDHEESTAWLATDVSVQPQPQHRRRSYGSPPRPVLTAHLEDALSNLLRLQSSISDDGPSRIVQTVARHASVTDTDMAFGAQCCVTTDVYDVTSEGLKTSANRLRVSFLMGDDGHDWVDVHEAHENNKAVRDGLGKNQYVYDGPLDSTIGGEIAGAVAAAATAPNARRLTRSRSGSREDSYVPAATAKVNARRSSSSRSASREDSYTQLQHDNAGRTNNDARDRQDERIIMSAAASADDHTDEYGGQSAYRHQVAEDHRAACASLTSTNSHYSVDTDVVNGVQPIQRTPPSRAPSTSKAISPRRSADVKSSLIMSAVAKAYGAVDTTVEPSVALSSSSAKDPFSSRHYTADHIQASSTTRNESLEPLWASDVVDHVDANRSGRSSSRLLLLSHSSRRLRDGSSKSLRSLPSSNSGGGYGAITELSSLLGNDTDEAHDALDTGDVGTKGREWCCFLCSMLLHSVQFVAAQLTADTELMFLGHLGTRQLAGAGLARFWIYVPLSFLLSGVGGWRLLFARGFWLQSALVVALSATPLLTCYYFHVDFFVSGTMLHPITRTFAKQYATLISPGILPLLTSTVVMQYLLARRVVVPVAVMATLACATTIGLHFLLVFGYKQWPGFGFDGSPYATMATFVLLLMLLVAYGGCCVGFGGLSWRRSSYRLDRLRVLWAMAVPAGIPSCLQSVVLTIFGAASAYTPSTSAARRLDESDGMDAGSQQAAAWVVTVCFFLLVLAFLRGAAAATAERMQLHLRRRDIARARHVLFVGAVYGAALGCLFATIVFKYGAPLLGLWTADAIVYKFCVDALPYLAACMALSSVRLVFAAGLTTLEKTKMLPLAANVDTWLVQVPLGLGLGIGLQLGVLGLWVARLTGELVHTMLLLYALMIDADAATYDAATPLLTASASRELDKTASDEASSNNVVVVPTAVARDRSLPVASTPVTNVGGDTLVGMDDAATAEIHLEAAPVHSPIENDAPLPWVRRRSSDGSATWVVTDDETALSPISEEGAVRAMAERPSPSASIVSREASSSDVPTATVVSASPAIRWVRQESTVGAVQWVEEPLHDTSGSSPSTQDEPFWSSSDVSSSVEATPRARSFSLSDINSAHGDISGSSDDTRSTLINEERSQIVHVTNKQGSTDPRDDDCLPTRLSVSVPSSSVPHHSSGIYFEEACVLASNDTDGRHNNESDDHKHDVTVGGYGASLGGNEEPVRDSNESQGASSRGSFVASLSDTTTPRALTPTATSTLMSELSTGASDDWIIAIPASDVAPCLDFDGHDTVTPKSTTAATKTSEQHIDSRPQSAVVQGRSASTTFEAQDSASPPPMARMDEDAPNSYVITIAPEVTRDILSNATTDVGAKMQRSALAIKGVDIGEASVNLAAPRPLSPMTNERRAVQQQFPTAMIDPALLDKPDAATAVHSSRPAAAMIAAPATTDAPTSHGFLMPAPVPVVALTFAEPRSAIMAEEASAKRVLHPASPNAQASAASGANQAPVLDRALSNAIDEVVVSVKEATRRRHRSKKKRGTVRTDTNAAESAPAPVSAPDGGSSPQNVPSSLSTWQQTSTATGYIDAGRTADHDGIHDMALSASESVAVAPQKGELPRTTHAPTTPTESPSLQYGKRSKKLRARQERKHHSAAAAPPAVARPPAPQMQAAMKDELLLLCFQIELLKHLQAA